MNNKYYYTCDLPGHGYGALFLVTLATLHYCVDNDIELYLDFKSDGYAENLDINCWETVFKQPFGISLKDAQTLEKKNNFGIIGHPFNHYEETVPYTGYWNLQYDTGGGVETRKKWQDPEFLNIYRKIIKNHVSPNDRILKIVNDYLEKYNNSKILGIHKRGRSHFVTGHGNSQGHLAGLDVIIPIIDKEINDYDYLYVMSDEPSIYQVFQSVYGDKVIFYDDKTQYSNHWDDLNRHSLSGEEKAKLLDNLIVEMLILSQCDRKILTTSNVSHMSLLFNDSNNFKFYDNEVIYY